MARRGRGIQHVPAPPPRRALRAILVIGAVLGGVAVVGIVAGWLSVRAHRRRRKTPFGA